ncbi:CPBP family glutamic-type intramembrane protease [Faecalimicrobium dakarense]|uniref:CPBP family glutamic-type intramembrane protease n=1 Tax=Faecalimicrobium dakarense TaxID=1301100 RepID=UPI0033130419
MLVFYAITMGPIIESILIIFITKLVGKFTKNKFKITIITAILFACGHTYSYEYKFLIFVPSLILVCSYVLYDNKSSKISSFSIMTIIHSLYNLMQILSTELIYYYLVN